MAKRAFTLSADLSNGGAANLSANGGGSRTLTEQTYAVLRTDIIEGRLVPGSKLRIEHLRTEHEVGAGTIREALTRLVSDALVTTEGQRGFRVSPVAIEDLEDITRLRVHIEIEALRQSMRNGDDAWRAQLRRAFGELSALERPIEPARRRQWEEANVRFHDALLAGHHSPWTARVLRVLSRHGERYRRFAIGLKDEKRDVHAEHAEIYEFAISGQEARAALALEAHIWATPYVLIKALRDGRIVWPGGDDTSDSS